MKKPDLKVVPSETLEVESKKSNLKDTKISNFWACCPKKLDYLPSEECDLGKKSAEQPADAEPSCPWFINSPKHNYCFWKWVQDRSLPDGRMDPLMQNEIAELLGCSSTKVHFILKEAIEKLKKSEHLHILGDYYGSSGNQDDDGTVDVSDYIPPSSDSDDSEF